jgi:hypothetical protein
MTQTHTAAALVTVTKEQFFAALKRCPIDIMPTLVGRYENGDYTSEWKRNGGQAFYGRSHKDTFHVTPEFYSAYVSESSR